MTSIWPPAPGASRSAATSSRPPRSRWSCSRPGHGGLAVSGLLLAASLPLAVLAPITGRIADRADSRTVLVVAGLAQAAVCAGARLRRPSGRDHRAGRAARLRARGHPADRWPALLPAMVRRDDLAKASGSSRPRALVGMLIAPALAGVLVGQTGAAGAAAARRGQLPGAGRGRACSSVPEGRAGGATTRRDRHGVPAARRPPLFVMIGAIAAVVAGVGAINVVEVFFIRETLGASTTVFGLVAASWTVGMLLGAVALRPARRSGPDHRRRAAGWSLAASPALPVLAGAAVGNALLHDPALDRRRRLQRRHQRLHSCVDRGRAGAGRPRAAARSPRWAPRSRAPAWSVSWSAGRWSSISRRARWSPPRAPLGLVAAGLSACWSRRRAGREIGRALGPA